MIRIALVVAVLLAVGAIKLPVERDLAAHHRQEHFRGVEFNLDLREKLGQLGFIAALSGFRAIVADGLFIQAHVAWERTEWGRVLLLFRHVTTLQPRAILFWDMAAWHMAWNASVAAMNDRTQPRLALFRRLSPHPQPFLSNRARRLQPPISVLTSPILLSMNTVTNRASRIPRIRMV